jgi:hypothetical protein
MTMTDDFLDLPFRFDDPSVSLLLERELMDVTGRKTTRMQDSNDVFYFFKVRSRRHFVFLVFCVL